ncbi:MAG: GHMP kinase [Thermoprotei archaeon]
MISAPGKVLWIGSYSVVFGGIGHVIAIDRRVRCSAEENDEWVFETSYGTFKGKGNELIESVLGVMREEFGDFGKFRVKLTNDPDFSVARKKTGLGSSSAATVALTACLYHKIKGGIDLNEVHRLAQKANYVRQRGIGSGFDIASAVFGSIVYRRFSSLEKMDCYCEPLRIGNYGMVLAFLGESAETVGLVRKFVEVSQSQKFKEMMARINEENEWAVKYLRSGRLYAAAQHVRIARDLLNALAKTLVGVEIENERTKRLEALAYAKGAIIALSPGAGLESVFAIAKDVEPIIEAWEREGVKAIRLKEDGGLRVEEGQG